MRIGHDQTRTAGVTKDELAIAGFMTVELEARLA
jgi:hypothetical protein